MASKQTSCARWQGYYHNILRLAMIAAYFDKRGVESIFGSIMLMIKSMLLFTMKFRLNTARIVLDLETHQEWKRYLTKAPS